MEEGSERFKNKYRVASARMQGWDYSGNGYYFVTICTDKRRCFFGFIKNGIMCVNTCGTIVHWCWHEILHHFHHVYLNEFVVMPNHVHAIITINHGAARNAGECGECRRRVEKRNEKYEWLDKKRGRIKKCYDDATYMCCRDMAMPRLYNTDVDDTIDVDKITHFASSIAPKSGSLSVIVGSFKSACTKTIRQMYPRIHFAWQTRFHDHVIRDGWALNNIRNYIRQNPTKWKNDIFLK